MFREKLDNIEDYSKIYKIFKDGSKKFQNFQIPPIFCYNYYYIFKFRDGFYIKMKVNW